MALRSVNLWALLLMALFYVFGLYFFISWLHTFLVKGRGFSENALLLSMAPSLLGACGNVSRGFLCDALTRRFGLKWGRRGLAFSGLACATVFMAATLLTTNQFATLLFLGLAYGGITLQQTVTAATVIDIGKQYVGGIAGLLQTIANVGGFLFSVSFGYFVKWFGSYDLALIPTVIALAIAALLWLRVDATEELIPESPAVSIPETAVPAIS
jgi:predicted MFS family arabinose efflux permease